jgi:hypothetical protein
MPAAINQELVMETLTPKPDDLAHLVCLLSSSCLKITHFAPGDPDSRKTDTYSSQESVPGSGFDNNAINLDTSGGYRDPNTSGSFERSDYATGNTGIDDTQGGSAFNKPSAGDKIRGSAEKMAGKMTSNQGMQERGQDRKTGLNDY